MFLGHVLQRTELEMTQNKGECVFIHYLIKDIYCLLYCIIKIKH